MAAVYVSNLVINAGADFSQVFTLESIATNSVLNLSTYTVTSQMRKHSASTSAINFDSSIVNPTAGTIKISLDSTTTTNIKPGRYIYDINAYNSSDGVTTRLIEGMVLVREGVTR
jgi:hypothetical protein